MKRLNESILENLNEKAYPIVSPEFEVYDGIFGSITNDDAVDALDELIKYFSDFQAACNEDSSKYQGADANKLGEVVNKLNEAKQMLDNMWNETSDEIEEG